MMFVRVGRLSEERYDVMKSVVCAKAFKKKKFAPFYVPVVPNYDELIAKKLSEVMHKPVYETGKIFTSRRRLYVFSVGKAGKVLVESGVGRRWLELTITSGISHVAKEKLLTMLFKKHVMTRYVVRVSRSVEELRVIGECWKEYNPKKHKWSKLVKAALD